MYLAISFKCVCSVLHINLHSVKKKRRVVKDVGRKETEKLGGGL